MTLPPLPEPDQFMVGIGIENTRYTADQMREYARMAVEAEREACAHIADRFHENSRYKTQRSLAALISMAIHNRGEPDPIMKAAKEFRWAGIVSQNFPQWAGTRAKD